MVELRKENLEVYYLNSPQKFLGIEDCKELMSFAANSKRNRARFCAHDNADSQIHEMFEVLTKFVYMRPHKQRNKCTSYHLIAGAMKVYLFDDTGCVTDVVSMSDYRSMKPFYFRAPLDVYRMLVPETDFVLYHEIRSGPFIKADTLFAPWAPIENDVIAIEMFISNL